ncbi:hypothetical protein [Undibacterium sp.]|uniref:hypothetical protein n=1 Tax=Undibacterium sp. TaxID=1914977 RepID=UPI002BD9BCAF|nr:hypothetical protein [Undibacterium sp.]HTD03048.1 hypothetical protein [Undibacterium sp.]
MVRIFLLRVALFSAVSDSRAETITLVGEAARYADLLDKGLLAIRANGTYAGLEKKWKAPPL